MRRVALISCALFYACSSGAPEEGVKQTAVLQSLSLAREDPMGVAPGFDLDGVNSDDRDSRSCGKHDFMDVDGHAGIDNQLARFIPLLDLTGEGALEGLVQTAINEGRLLVIFDIETFADGHARVTAMRGEDTPLLGTNNLLLAGQTLSLNAADPVLGAAAEGRMEGNVLEAGPFDLKFPIVVFEVLYELKLYGAYVRFTIDEDGGLSNGVLGGAATVEQLLDFLRTAGDKAGADFVGLIGHGIADDADLVRDGSACTRMSMAVTFKAVSAFTF